MSLFFSLWLKLFFVLTPFFGLTMFLTMTEGFDEPRRRDVARSTSLAVFFLCLILFFAGNQIFSIFGITLDSFRIGAGILLLLSGIALVQGNSAGAASGSGDDFTVVPLAIPIIVGPATMGTLLVLGAELDDLGSKFAGIFALTLAVASIAVVLYMGSAIQKRLGVRGISILSKLTGLILSALAAQMIMTGIQGFLIVKP